MIPDKLRNKIIVYDNRPRWVLAHRDGHSICYDGTKGTKTWAGTFNGTPEYRGAKPQMRVKLLDTADIQRKYHLIERIVRNEFGAGREGPEQLGKVGHYITPIKLGIRIVDGWHLDSITLAVEQDIGRKDLSTIVLCAVSEVQHPDYVRDVLSYLHDHLTR